MTLPPTLQREYEHFAPAIAARLKEFTTPKTHKDMFYEFCYCICTPQSKALHAWRVVEQLQALDFYTHGFDPTFVLADRIHYIRFHNTKAARLLALREQFSRVERTLAAGLDAFELRRWVARNVQGFGLKEASHVLRNLGWFEVAILDRHILRNLVRYGVVSTGEPPRSEEQYTIVERAFQNFARSCGIELQALDLLLWAIETGMVLK